MLRRSLGQSQPSGETQKVPNDPGVSVKNKAGIFN